MDAILEATIQVLVEVGYAKLTTTRVAVRAGVSVGSLYQYFPSKDALVRALIERKFARTEEVLREAVEASRDLPFRDGFRAALRAVLQLKAERPELTKVISEQLPRVAGIDVKNASSRASAALVTDLLTEHADELGLDDPQRVAWVVTYAVEGVISASIREQADLGDPALLDELCRLVDGYLG